MGIMETTHARSARSVSPHQPLTRSASRDPSYQLVDSRALLLSNSEPEQQTESRHSRWSPRFGGLASSRDFGFGFWDATTAALSTYFADRNSRVGVWLTYDPNGRDTIGDSVSSSVAAVSPDWKPNLNSNIFFLV